MPLYTASVQTKRKKNDGVRISIMRFNRHYYDYDVWIPALAPSKELLFGYKDGKISWEQYEARFRREVLDKQKPVLKALTAMALDNVVTLLCWEETPEQCHRRLVAEECKKYDPALEVILR